MKLHFYREIRICRNKADKKWEYISPNDYRGNLTPMDAMALFIAQMSGSIQYSEDNDEDVNFIISIEKRVK